MGMQFINNTPVMNNINQAQRVVDMQGELAQTFLAPRISPFLFTAMKPQIPYGNPDPGTQTVRFNTRSVFNTKFDWLEDELRGFHATIDSAALDSSSLSIPVNNANIFQLGDIVLVPATGEIIRVNVIDYDNNVLSNVTRAFGTTVAGALADTGVLQVIGNVNAENSRSRPTQDTLPNVQSNYIQTTKHPFDGSDKIQQVDLYGIKDYRQYKRSTKFIEHLYSIESTLLFGEPKLGSEYGGSAPENQTGGLLYWLQENRQNASGTLTRAVFDGWLREAFNHTVGNGGNEKFLLAGSALTGAINKFTGTTTGIQTTTFVNNLETKFGVKIRTYQSDSGLVHIIPHGLLTGAKYGGYGILIDPMLVKIARLKKGNWFQLYTDIQENDREGWKDEYRTDFGLEVKQPKCHGVLYGVTG
jgi:hypothetical protein